MLRWSRSPKKDSSLRKELLKTKGDARECARQFATECRDVARRLDAAGIDFSATIDQTYEETRFYQVGRLITVGRCRARMAALLSEFNAILDDAVAIMRCEQRSEDLRRAYVASRAMIADLERRRLAGTSPTIGTILVTLTEQADRLVSELDWPEH